MTSRLLHGQALSRPRLAIFGAMILISDTTQKRDRE
jgi:hypothetical protein